MAAGHSLVGGGVGVCCGTVGPGATNLVSGVAAAYMASLPMLVLTAQVGTPSIGRGAVAGSRGRRPDLLSDPASLSGDEVFDDGHPLDQGPRSAAAGVADCPQRQARPGTSRPACGFPAWSGRARDSDPGAVPSRAEYVASRIRSPAGLGASLGLQEARDACRGGAVRDAVRRPCSGSLNCSPVRSPRRCPAKARCPRITLSLSDVYGLYGTRAANSYMRSGLDVLLVVGSSLHEFTTHVWDPALRPTTALIHIDIDPEEIGKNYPADVGLLGDAEDVLGALLAQIERAQERGTEPGWGPRRAQSQVGVLRRAGHGLDGGAAETPAGHGGVPGSPSPERFRLYRHRQHSHLGRKMPAGAPARHHHVALRPGRDGVWRGGLRGRNLPLRTGPPWSCAGTETSRCMGWR